LTSSKKLADAEKSQDSYVCKDEFKDLLEETLQRIANEPDENRRRWFKNILLKAIEQPRDHSEHRLFLRLTNELTALARGRQSRPAPNTTRPAIACQRERDAVVVLMSTSPVRTMASCQRTPSI
jgi:hypothetical protein